MDLGGAGAIVGHIFRERSLHNYDQAGPRMGVPSSVSADWPRVLEDINVGISLHLRLEVPPILLRLVAHQVEQAIWERAHRQDLSVKPASGRCADRRGCQHGDDNQRRCDEKESTSKERAVN